jgi:16S rRNA (guanine966-N2)-methyltransferase
MSCLDLYAGTGALGIEALSRGAERVTFVEPSRLLVPALRIQLEELGASASVVNSTAEQFLANTQDRFDLVFADPPFGVDPRAVWSAIATILRAGGALYCERAAAAGLPDLDWGEWQKKSTAGDVIFGLARVQHRD